MSVLVLDFSVNILLLMEQLIQVLIRHFSHKQYQELFSKILQKVRVS